MCKVSFIIPVYNAEKTIEKCINSILNQTYVNIEVIAVDDGSQDNSGWICDEISKRDSRFKVVHIINRGVSHARNVGLQVSTGELIQFVDSDDYLDSEMTESLVREMDSHNSDWSCCGYKMITNDDSYSKLERNFVIGNQKELKSHFAELFAEAYFHTIWNKLYKRNLIITEFDENLPIGEDLIFNIEYMKKVSKICFSGVPYYNYNCINTNNNLTVKFHENGLDCVLKQYDKIEEFINNYLDGQISWETIANSYCRDVIRVGRKCIAAQKKRTFFDKYMSVIPIHIKKVFGKKMPSQIAYRLVFSIMKTKNYWILYFILWGYQKIRS